MGELVDRDQEHLLLLKWGFYVLSAMACMGAAISLLASAIMAVAAFSGALDHRGASGPPEEMLYVMGGFVCVMVLITLTVAALTFYAARSVAARRRRIFCIVVAALWCLQLSFGAVIGVCAIMVLTRPTVRALFEPPPPPVATA